MKSALLIFALFSPAASFAQEAQQEIPKWSCSIQCDVVLYKSFFSDGIRTKQSISASDDIAAAAIDKAQIECNKRGVASKQQMQQQQHQSVRLAVGMSDVRSTHLPNVTESCVRN
jgi:hypothetical protein